MVQNRKRGDVDTVVVVISLIIFFSFIAALACLQEKEDKEFIDTTQNTTQEFIKTTQERHNKYREHLQKLSYLRDTAFLLNKMSIIIAPERKSIEEYEAMREEMLSLVNSESSKVLIMLNDDKLSNLEESEEK